MDAYKSYSHNDSESPEGLSIREIIEFLLRLKWWIVGSAFVALVLAVFLVRMQNPVYERSSWIMLNRDDGSTGEFSLMAQMTGNRMRKKIDNEMYILKSPSLMRKVVEELGLNTRYYRYTLPFGDKHIKHLRGLFPQRGDEFYKDAPFTFSIQADSLLPAAQQVRSVRVEFKHSEKGPRIREIRVDGKKVDISKLVCAYGEPIRLDRVTLCVQCNDPLLLDDGVRYACSWTAPFLSAEGFAARLNVEAQGKQKSSYYISMCDVVSLSIEDTKPARADDILNTLVIKNNEEAKRYTNEASYRAIAFIDERLSDISNELGNVERNVKEYQSRNSLVDLDSQAGLTVSSDLRYRDQLTELKLQRRILEMVGKEVHNAPSGEYRVIPSNIGLTDTGLNGIISQYNTLVAERNRLVANSSENNPRVTSLQSSIEDARKGIELSIANLDNAYGIRERELEDILMRSQRRISDIPRQQLEIQQLSRKMEIIEPLYLLLQQKREEAQIAMYSQSDDFRVIEASFGSPSPIRPRPMTTYLLALIIGFCLPPALMWLQLMLKTKVETRKDVEDRVEAPILAVLPRKNVENGGVLLKKNGRDAFSEAFRMLRSNLQFMPSAQVIQVTSSMPGEGKSFVSSNLAISISHIGKKVLLLGLDLRKPALPDMFPEVEFDPQRSVVAALIRPDLDPMSLPSPSKICPTLDLLFSGPIPPNPSELLAQGGLEKLIGAYREKYDYIIVDSAPYLPVTDSSLINPFVDLTLYVVRANHTEMRYLDSLQSQHSTRQRQLNNLCMVLNDLDIRANHFKYGYGSGYGYGYEYGYGND